MRDHIFHVHVTVQDYTSPCNFGPDSYVLVRQRHKMSGFKRLTYIDPNRSYVPDSSSQFGWVLGVLQSEQLPAAASCPSRFISWRMCSPLALPGIFFVCVYGSKNDSTTWFPLTVPNSNLSGTNVVLRFSELPNMPTVTTGPLHSGSTGLVLVVPHPGNCVEPAYVYSSDDCGLSWSLYAQNTGCLDDCALFYNPFRNVWIWSFRENTQSLERVRRYQEVASPDIAALCHRAEGWYTDGDAVWWVVQSVNISAVIRRMAAKLPDLLNKRTNHQHPSVYRVSETPYESIMLVMLSHFIGRNKNWTPYIFLDIATSHDGFHISGWPEFDSADYTPLIGLPPDKEGQRYAKWLQSLLIDEDHVYLHWCNSLIGEWQGYAASDGDSVTCYQGWFRRDGFASLNTGPGQTGTLVTRLLTLKDQSSYARLHVNAACSAAGNVRVSVLNQGEVHGSASVIGVDSTDVTIEQNLQFSNRFQLKFQLSDCQLYSFWFTFS